IGCVTNCSVSVQIKTTAEGSRCRSVTLTIFRDVSAISALGQKRTFAEHSCHPAFLSITQMTTPITKIAATKTIRKVFVSSAIQRPLLEIGVQEPAGSQSRSGHHREWLRTP